MQTWHFVGIATLAVTVTVTVDVLWGTAFHLATGVLFTNDIDIDIAVAAAAAAAAAVAIAAAAAAVAGGASAGAAFHQRCHSTRFLCFLSLLFFLFRPYDTN